MESITESKLAHEEAHDRLEALTEELKKTFPDHKLSFGYIGNVTPRGDDRGFYIFTRYYDWDQRRSVMFGLGGFKSLRFDATIERAIRRWVSSLQAQVDKGLIQSRS